MKKVFVPREEQIIVRNTHEALVSQEDFNFLQQKHSKRPKRQRSNKEKKPNKYDGCALLWTLW